MKKIIYNKVDYSIVKKLIDLSYKKGNEVNQYEGGLLDNYLIVNTGKIVFNKTKARKYIIVKEKYLNCWSSTYEVIFTDSIDEYNNWKNIFDNENKEVC